MIKCKHCVYRTFRIVSVLNENFIRQPIGSKLSHDETRLHCAFYPEWEEVTPEHYCGQGRQAKSICIEENEK